MQIATFCPQYKIHTNKTSAHFSRESMFSCWEKFRWKHFRGPWDHHKWLLFGPEQMLFDIGNSLGVTGPPAMIRGGNKIWIFKPQVNFDVIPTYKHGGKWFFEFGGHLNPPHLRWSFRFFGDFRPFQRNLYIFINAGLEPKLFEIKSSTQQQSCKAHKIGQFCHQDQPSICLCSRVTDRATTAFQLAPKW